MNSSTPTLEISEIFKQYRCLLKGLLPEQEKVVQAIVNCRTEVLGGHQLKCNDCEFSKNAYNSCRNRHCPKCQFLAKTKWIEKRCEDLLPCQYFHVVFSVPSNLRPLILRNKEVCYNIILKAASDTLKEVAANPKNLGADIGFIGVLHTWSQSLIDHPHVHFIVPGGGLNKKKTKWITCKKDYFLPVKVLSKVFKGKALELLNKAFKSGELKFMGKIEELKEEFLFDELLRRCSFQDWVVYSKETFAGPKQVINYLGGYTHRIAISNYRLIKLEGEKVHFYIRDREKPGEKKIMVLHVEEFMRRFLLHVLPKGFTRIRHYGLLGNRWKKIKLEIIRTLNGIIKELKDSLEESWRDIVKRHTGYDPRKCPKCRNGTLFEVAVMRNLLLTG